MKRLLLTLAALLTSAAAVLSQPLSKEEYRAKYQRVTSRVGVDGVGVETLVGQWVEAWPEDARAYLARFSYYYKKCQSSKVIQLPQDRYLGKAPLLPMKDSSGRKNNYFEDIVFDDALYAKAEEAISKVISLEPLHLDYRLVRITAMTAYEKGSPDMAMMELKSLVDKNFSEHPKWIYEGVDSIGEDEFKALMQEYCYTFFRLGTPQSAEAFKELSEHLLKYYKNDPLFLDNIGSYYLVFKKDSKKALKYYNQVLRKHPDDLTALQNCILLARSTKDTKLEKKYQEKLAKIQGK